VLAFADPEMYDQDIYLDLRPLKETPNASAKGRLTLHVVIEPTATGAGGSEGTAAHLEGPAVPAVMDLVLNTGAVAGTAASDATATWTALEPLHGLLSSPVLANLVKAVDELVKVSIVIFVYWFSALILVRRFIRT